VPDLEQIFGTHEATLLKRHNDVYRIGEYFVKLHTKAWYADDPRAWAGAVQHEVAAYACVAQHGLAAPEVVLALTTGDNLLGRPCLVTRALHGQPLTSAVQAASRQEWQTLLEQTGEYLRRLHAITFPNAGYIMRPKGPDAGSPGFEHPCWTMPDGKPCQPPRFTHGDCHAHQLFVGEHGITGIVDMEVASAGDPSSDLFKFGLEMAALFSPTTRWWEPFFAGYGGAPELDTLRRRMLTATEDNYACLGLEKQKERLLHARDWQELFTLRSRALSSD
jgi:aminoglycoside phosphotransferase (APT) family kinase protein